MKTIYKYELAGKHPDHVQMPAGAKLLSVHMQGDQACVWAQVDTDNPLVHRVIHMIGTGQEMCDRDLEMPFIGTIQWSSVWGPMVFHVFDGGER